MNNGAVQPESLTRKLLGLGAVGGDGFLLESNRFPLSYPAEPETHETSDPSMLYDTLYGMLYDTLYGMLYDMLYDIFYDMLYDTHTFIIIIPFLHDTLMICSYNFHT